MSEHHLQKADSYPRVKCLQPAGLVARLNSAAQWSYRKLVLVSLLLLLLIAHLQIFMGPRTSELYLKETRKCTTRTRTRSVLAPVPAQNRKMPVLCRKRTACRNPSAPDGAAHQWTAFSDVGVKSLSSDKLHMYHECIMVIVPQFRIYRGRTLLFFLAPSHYYFKISPNLNDCVLSARVWSLWRLKHTALVMVQHHQS